MPSAARTSAGYHLAGDIDDDAVVWGVAHPQVMTDSLVADGSEQQRRLSGNLGVARIVFMVVAAAAPLGAIGGGMPLGFMLGNGVGFPMMYGISAVILLLFAVGLAAMTRHVHKPGAFFTFVGYGLGRMPGLATAYLALFTYTTAQIAVNAYLGYLLRTTSIRLGGPNVPWWVYNLAGIAAIGVLGFRHIELSGKVLAVLLVSEVGIALVLVAAIVFSGKAPQGLSLAPFMWQNATSGAPGVGLTFALTAFVGFESTAIFRDEAKHPHRTIPRATYVAVIGIGIFYALTSWGLVMAWGPSAIVATAAKNPGTLLVTTTQRYLGPSGVLIVNVLLITSTFACALAFHNVITRYQHAMSKAQLLPSPLSRVHHQHHSPHTSSIVQTGTAAALAVIFGALGLDPLLQVLTWWGGVATLAITLLMVITSVAIIVYFVRTRTDRRWWNTVVAPALGVVGLTLVTVLIVSYFPTLLDDVDAHGEPRYGGLTWFMFGLVGAVPTVGMIQALILRSTRPSTYDRILDAISESSDAIATAS